MIATHPPLRECSGCGLFQIVPRLEPGNTASCARCGTALRRAKADPITTPLALHAAALVLLIVVALTTLMTVSTAGISHQANLFSGPAELWRRGMWSLAAVVVFATAAAPLAVLSGTLYVLIGLRAATPPRHLRKIFGWVELLRPWSMIEVFVFGVFVAYVKLGDIVKIQMDIGVLALLALTIVMIWASVEMDREAVWEAVSNNAAPVLSDRLPVVSCELCGMVDNVRTPHDHGHCLRCDSVLHPRKPDAINRTWALMLAAAILYIPANLYPVLTVVQLGAGAPSTIMGGVEELLSSKMYPLALLVFFASIAVPMLKLVGLAVMLITTQTRSVSWLTDRTKLYHFVRWIGRWSMIDIFMESLLGALVRFGSVATIQPGIGAVAFCGVVILTMLAAECFDPRMMWDAAETRTRVITNTTGLVEP